MTYEGMQNLGEQTLPAIHNAITQSVINGSTITQMTNQISGKLGKFEQYAKTYIVTAKREFIQKTENYVAEKINFGSEKDDIWEYIGAPLQDNSHPECVWALEQKENAPYFTNAEKEEFESGGGYPHTEPRWNCQHNFMITDMTYAEAFGEDKNN